MKMDQPLKALEAYEKSLKEHKTSVSLLLGMSRCHDSVNNFEEALSLYKRVTQLEPSNVEALACLANDHFYNDQPEIALRYYRRLLQVRSRRAELSIGDSLIPPIRASRRAPLTLLLPFSLSISWCAWTAPLLPDGREQRRDLEQCRAVLLLLFPV